MAGDFCPNNRVKSLMGKHKVFENVTNVVKDSDFAVVNLECPVLAEGCRPLVKEGPNLHCDESAIEELAFAGFNVATLANNHILDYGSRSLEKSIEACAKYQIKTVGAGSDSENASVILYLERSQKTVAIINCCEHEFSISSDCMGGANPLNPIQQYYQIKEARRQADYVILIVHGGMETCQLPTPRMKQTYRFFVDAGVDAVINHHQHCYSGYEVYNGKPIFYGLGNFCFDWEGEGHSPWNEGYMVKLVYDEDKCSFELIPYKQCNEEITVSLMVGEEKLRFEKRILELNRILADDALLEVELEEIFSKTEKDYLSIFEPYSGRIPSGLYRRNLLPSMLTKKRMVKLLDFLECESHYDRILYFLKKKYKVIKNE